MEQIKIETIYIYYRLWMCFSHNVQRTVHHHALTQGIGLHPRKLTWPIKKENCTYYLKMAIFPLPSYFTGKESWNIPPSNPFWVPSQWTWLVILSKVPSFSSTKNPHFLHNLVLARWWWVLQLGNHILRCPGWGQDGLRIIKADVSEPKQPEPHMPPLKIMDSKVRKRIC